MSVEIEVLKIDPSPFQPRINLKLEEIEESVKQDGIIQRLIVRPIGERYQLIDGERRWRVAQKLGLPTVPCEVREADDTTARRLVWTLNTQRKDYEPKEKALYFKRLIEEEKLTLRKIAEVFNIDHHTVASYLNTLRLPEKYQEMVWNGQIGIGVIRELEPLFASGEYSPKIAELLDHVVEKGLSQKQLREALKPALKEIEEKKVEEAKKAVPEVEVKLETPEAYREAAEALKRKAEEIRPAEEKLRAVREKAKGALAKFLTILEKAKSLGVETSEIEKSLEELKPIMEKEDYSHVLKTLQNLNRQLKTLKTKAIEEKHKREIEEKVKKELREEAEKEILSKPRAVEEAWERARYNELYRDFPWLLENKDIIDEKALKPLVQTLEKGKATAFKYMIMNGLEQEAKKRKGFVGRKKRMTSKDVAKIIRRYGVEIPTGEKKAEDPEYEDALKHYPYPLVTLVWTRFPKTKRLEALRKTVEIMYMWLEHRADEIMKLALQKI